MSLGTLEATIKTLAADAVTSIETALGGKNITEVLDTAADGFAKQHLVIPASILTKLSGVLPAADVAEIESDMVSAADTLINDFVADLKL